MEHWESKSWAIMFSTLGSVAESAEGKWRLRSGTGTRKARLAASGLQRRIKLGKWKGKKVRKLMYSRNTGGVRAVKINTILRSSHAVSLLYKVGSEWSQTALPLIL
ncbi:Hypothetical protein NTJ_01002 [Nesidiocoris tenuis]|uniref:Uncharacterized protein n=1 Tax=Nesidiocoris tenuis TaxID=355587 RepID=A0ABN7A7H0_9HEMI|nr:Hypothetical protein NTJ_01002 [Nesidiocoris tenuis]